MDLQLWVNAIHDCITFNFLSVAYDNVHAKTIKVPPFGIPNLGHRSFLAATTNSIEPHDAAHGACCKAVFQKHYNFCTH